MCIMLLSRLCLSSYPHETQQASASICICYIYYIYIYPADRDRSQNAIAHSHTDRPIAIAFYYNMCFICGILFICVDIVCRFMFSFLQCSKYFALDPRGI